MVLSVSCSCSPRNIDEHIFFELGWFNHQLDLKDVVKKHPKKKEAKS